MKKRFKNYLQFFSSKDDQDQLVHKDFNVSDLKTNDDERGVIEGYAATFGNLDRHGDIIERGTFKGGRTKIPIFALHRADKAVGVGYVQEDQKGLKIKMKLAVDNADSEALRERAREYYAMAKEGIIEKMSVGMIITEREWQEKAIDGKKMPVRVIKKADLVETSLVPIPANDKARITTVKEYDQEDLDQRIQAAVQKALEEMAADHEEDDDEDPGDQEEQNVQRKSSYEALVASRLGLF